MVNNKNNVGKKGMIIVEFGTYSDIIKLMEQIKHNGRRFNMDG